jgi:hypothetical protein
MWIVVAAPPLVPPRRLRGSGHGLDGGPAAGGGLAAEEACCRPRPLLPAAAAGPAGQAAARVGHAVPGARHLRLLETVLGPGHRAGAVAGASKAAEGAWDGGYVFIVRYVKS